MSRAQDPFFKTIGSLAEQADNLPDQPDDENAPTDGSNANVVNDDNEERPLQEIESLCMSCEKQGVTRLMLTSIPYFREVIVMSFRCEHCGNTNNEVQAAGEIREQGVTYTAKILDRTDLNRQLVKAATCTIVIPEFELTIPAHRGQLTTVEGLIRDTVLDLSRDQPLRRVQDKETWGKIKTLLDKLRPIVRFEEDDEDEDFVGEVNRTKAVDDDDENAPITPFTVKLDDPAGNSWVEFYGSTSDPKWSMRQYVRTREQDVELGLASQEEDESREAHARALQNILTQPGSLGAVLKKVIEDDDVAGPNDEIFVFHGICSSCSAPVDTMMKKVVIPYFKDILIMSTNCDRCGYRDNEVKSGAAISEKGKRITLKVEDMEDMARDILKSETCGFEIPEIELTLQPGTLGGRFTTLEGILNQVYEELSEKAFARGDSSEASQGRQDFQTFLGKLKEVLSVIKPFTIILDDPLANSYLQNIYAPDPDPNMTTETYERTWDQNEELGLNDMKVEGYEEDGDHHKEEVKDITEAIKGEEGGIAPTV